MPLMSGADQHGCPVSPGVHTRLEHDAVVGYTPYGHIGTPPTHLFDRVWSVNVIDMWRGFLIALCRDALLAAP